MENKTLFSKLANIQKSVQILKKDGKVKDGFRYTSSEETLKAIKQEMDKYNLILIPSIKDAKTELMTIQGKGNSNDVKHMLITNLMMEWEWVDTENPSEKLTIPWYGLGTDYGSERGFGKALTYSEKYFLLKFFHIPTSETDPDRFQNQTKQGNQLNNQQPKQNQANERLAMQNRIMKLINDGRFTRVEYDKIIHSFGVDSFSKLNNENVAKVYNEIMTRVKEAANNTPQSAPPKQEEPKPIPTKQTNESEKQAVIEIGKRILGYIAAGVVNGQQYLEELRARGVAKIDALGIEEAEAVEKALKRKGGIQ